MHYNLPLQVKDINFSECTSCHFKLQYQILVNVTVTSSRGGGTSNLQ
jgi:hypothetical protein